MSNPYNPNQGHPQQPQGQYPPGHNPQLQQPLQQGQYPQGQQPYQQQPYAAPHAHQQPYAQQQPYGQAGQPAKKGTKISVGQIISYSVLGFVLLVVVGMLIYDKGIAGPAHKSAFENISDKIEQDDRVTKATIQKLVGKKPAVEEERGRAFVETYTWARGIPALSYSVSVVYQFDRNSGEYYGYKAYLNSEPGSNDLPSPVFMPRVVIGENDKAPPMANTGRSNYNGRNANPPVGTKEKSDNGLLLDDPDDDKLIRN